jgi:hypothetical protein
MTKKITGLLGMALLAGLFACASAALTPLQNLNGAWTLSFDETVAENPELREVLNTNSPEVEAYLRSKMQGMALLVDTGKNTLSLRSPDEPENVLNFTVASQTPEDNTVVLNVNEEEFILIVSPQRLIWVEGDGSMVFVRSHEN